MKGFSRYWGYLAFIILVTAWWSRSVGPVALIVLSLLVTAYFLFQAPVWCGAVNRDETLCRNNSGGLLLGCSKRQHKWQKLQMAVVPHAWRRMNRGLWTSPQTGLATLGAIFGLISTAAGAVEKVLQ
jgi:uncharacterized protein YjeT (DUF2065 family)